MSAVSNLAVILYFLFLNDAFGITGLAAALTFGWALQLAILLPPLWKTGYRFSFAFRQDEGMRKSGRLVLPVLVSSWAQPVNTLIGINVVSFVGGGESVSVLNYAYKLYLIVAGVFAFAMTNLFFPKLSLLSAQGKTKESGETLKGILTSVYLITLPVAVFFLLFSADIVKVVYQRGEFTAFSAQLTAPALCLYSLGMVGFSFQEILNKFNYANQNSKTPMKAALLSIVLNVALSAFFAFAFKNAALVALSSAISVTAAAGWLLGSARKSLGRDAFSGFWNTLLKGLVCAAAAGAVMKLLHDVFSVGEYRALLLFFACGVLFCLGAALFAAGLYLLKVGEIRTLFKNLKSGK